MCCDDELELMVLRGRLKLVGCPGCGAVGHLVFNGLLLGYCDDHEQRVRRAQRVLCSNRGRRAGCGRSFSVFWSWVLRRCHVSAFTLWEWLEGLGQGLSRKAAWERAAPWSSLSTGYRLWKRIDDAQATIRQMLCRTMAPPACQSTQPLLGMVAHMAGVFADAVCPIAGFQSRFQRAFLRPT